MLKQRILTAIVLLPLFVWAVLFMPAKGFAVLLALFVALGAWEWSAMMPLQSNRWRLMYCTLLMVCLAATAYLLGTHSEYLIGLLWVAAVWWIVALLLVLRFPQSTAWWGALPIKAASGFLVLIPCWIALVYLKVHGGAAGYWLLVLFILIWSADSGAYFSGRRFGKNKLAPSVSPGKSWEGVIGGALAAAVAVLIALNATERAVIGNDQYFSLGVLVVLTVAFSVLGDLFESMAKRIVGLKDSGKLLPGHGGVLDRIDSVTAAAPIFALGLIIITGQSDILGI